MSESRERERERDSLPVLHAAVRTEERAERVVEPLRVRGAGGGEGARGGERERAQVVLQQRRVEDPRVRDGHL